MDKDILEQARLKELLHYNPETGVFVRIADVTCGRGRAIAKEGDEAGYTAPSGYQFIRIDGKLHRAHRLAWLYVHGSFPSKMLDHVDGDRANNAIANLRLATPSQNLQNKTNKSARGATGLLGVSRQRGKYRATIQCGGASQSLGTFNAPEEASNAYWRAKRQLHEFCPESA